jgi:hypothetical protein
MSLPYLEKSQPGVNFTKGFRSPDDKPDCSKPLISVKTVETINIIEKAEFGQKVEFSSSMY